MRTLLATPRFTSWVGVLLTLTVFIFIGSLTLEAQEPLPLPLSNGRAITELIENGDFEIDTDSDNIPDNWTGKNTEQAFPDKQKCDKPNKLVAHSGTCAFQFKGNIDGTTSSIEQEVNDTSALVNGAVVVLSAYLDPRSSIPDTVFGKALVKYDDDSKQKWVLAVPSEGERGVADYVLISDTEILAIPAGATITKVKVKFSYITASGKYFLDDASFAVGTADPTGTPDTSGSPTNLPLETPTEDATGAVTATLDPSITVTNPPLETATEGATDAATATSGTTAAATITTTAGATANASATPGATSTSGGIPTNTKTTTPTATTLIINTPTKTPTPTSTNTPTPIPTSGPTDSPTSIPTSTPVTEAKLLASDGVSGDLFGNAVAFNADGTIALVGAYFDQVGTVFDAGSVYFYTRSGSVWTQRGQLLASDGTGNHWFGSAIAMSDDGNTAVIGAPQHNNDVPLLASSGAVYIFVRSGNNWLEQQILQADDKASFDEFGISVDISSDGDTILVGANQDDVGANTDQGSAYVFARSGNVWTQQQKLLGSNSAAEDRFGFAVALNNDGTTAVVGAILDDIGANSSQGSAYVFTRSGITWTEQQQLVASDGEPSSEFGWSVAISGGGSTVLVGSPDKDLDGAVYAFTRSSGNWTQQQKLFTSDNIPFGSFGNSVTLSDNGNKALIGAPDADIDGKNAQGTAYVFTRSGAVWTEGESYTADDGLAEDNFSIAVDLSNNGNFALVGAQGDDADRGGAYTFIVP